MPVTVFTFRFSPPARLVHLTAELCKIGDLTYEEVDLSKGEQLTDRFLAINPKHQVPAIVVDGRCMAESRDICRYLFDEYNQDPANDHWYPKDPEKRKAVDEWMDWSKSLHLAVEFGVVVEHVACQAGMNWRPNYGCVITLAGAVSRAKGSALKDLKKYVSEAEDIVGKQNKKTVQELDLGDVATFMELTVVMECHPAFKWDDYRNLSRLYSIMRAVPEFDKVHKPFLEFIAPFKEAQAGKKRATFWECLGQCFTGFKTIYRVVSVSRRKPATRNLLRGSTRELH